MKRAATVKAAAMLMLVSSWSFAAPVPVIEITESPVARPAGGGAQSVRIPPAGGYSVQNEMLFTVQQLQDEVRKLRGTVEEQQHKLQQLEQQQRDRYRDMDRRLTLLMAAVPEESLVAARTALEQPSPVSDPPDSTTEPKQAVTTAGDGSAYESAYSHVRQRDYVQAEQAFERFLSEYQDSALVPNAWYWLGEVKLAQDKAEAAASAFNQVVESYPRHAKAADALYKLGVLANRGRDVMTARRLMQRVQDEYPQSSAAGLARSFLSTQQ